MSHKHHHKLNKKKANVLRKADNQIKVKSVWPFPLSFCEGSHDDDIEFSEDKTFEEQSASICLSDHLFAVDDDFDFCEPDNYPTAQELTIMCQVCESAGSPSIDWASVLLQCSGVDVITPVKNLPCCSIVAVEMLDDDSGTFIYIIFPSNSYLSKHNNT